MKKNKQQHAAARQQKGCFFHAVLFRICGDKKQRKKILFFITLLPFYFNLFFLGDVI